MKKSSFLNDPVVHAAHEPVVTYGIKSGMKSTGSEASASALSDGENAVAPPALASQWLTLLDNPAYQGPLLLELLEVSGLSMVFIAEQVFEMTPKTLNTYIKDQQKILPARFTEHALRLLELYKYGAEVLGDLAFMRRWMARPSYGLNQRIPLTYMHTLTGIDFIRDELVRIEFGSTA